MADLVPDEGSIKQPDLVPDEGSVLAPAPQAAAPAPAAPPSLLSRVAGQVAQPFKDIGRGVLQANRAVTHAIFHPVDTFNAIRATPIAHAREAMRSLNDQFPFANRAVEAIGGPPAYSAEDAAAAPDTRAIGDIAFAPVGGELLGGVAAKVASKAAPLVARAAEGFGESAEARQVARTKEALELKVNKGTRAGLKSDVVDTAIADNPALQKAAGNDAKVAEVTASIKGKAAATLKPIYQAAGPADEAAAKAVSNVDARIDELKKGDVNAAAAAKKLQALRDEFNNRLGERPEVSATDLRAEQSAYQKNGYAKNINADPDVAAGILAQREMSKAVGDAVVEHVTGMNYQAAKAAASADPDSLAARLLKANDQINAANKIEAGVADRAGRAQPPAGMMGIAKKVAHSPHGFVLSKIPEAAAGAARLADRAVAATAPRIASAARGIGEAAAGGTPLQRVQALAATGNSRAAKLLANLRGAGAPGTPAIGSATSGTLAATQ